MRIAVTGGTGLLGTALADELAGENEVCLISDASTVGHEGCVSARADISDAEGISKAFDGFKPEAIVHTAALTNVDFCEDHRKEADALNQVGTANVARYAAKHGLRLIHISTDYVFDGLKKGGKYVEADEVNPVNYYAITKLAGEREVEAAGGNYAILRTALYGWNVRGKKNYSMIFYENLSQGKPVKAFANQYNSPMLANDLATVIARAVESDCTGVFHAGCATRTNRVEFAMELADVFGLKSDGLVEGTQLTDGMLPAKRPPDVSLESAKLANALGIKIPTLREGIERMRKLKEEDYESRFEVASA